MRRLCQLVVAILLALVLGGCASPHQSSAEDVSPLSWEEAVEFTLPNSDTLTLREVEIYLRGNQRFAEDSLTVRLLLLTPDSLGYAEPFTLVIPHATPSPVAREVTIPYRSRVRFTRLGDYRLRITPTRPVKGLEAVGINIQKSK